MKLNQNPPYVYFDHMFLLADTILWEDAAILWRHTHTDIVGELNPFYVHPV